jgi:hypothetical protein
MSGRHKFQDQHTVVLVKASGTPRPGGGDAKRIAYYHPGCNVWISKTTKEIIDRYYEWKAKHQVVEESNILDEDDDDVEDGEVGSENDYDDEE